MSRFKIYPHGKLPCRALTRRPWAAEWARLVSPTHTGAGAVAALLLVKMPGHARAWELLPCCWWNCFLSQFFRISPLTQDSLTRARGQAARDWSWVHPDMVQHLTTGSAFTINLWQSGLQPKKGHLWNSFPPLLTLGYGCFHVHTRAFLFAVQHKRDILPGNTSLKDILLDRLDSRGLQTLAEILILKEDLQGQLQRRKWTNSQALRR